MKILLVHPGASVSTADVEAGLRYGLEQHGVQVIRYRLDTRIAHAARWLHAAARRARKTNASVAKPTTADIFYQAGLGVVERALRHQVDVVLVVSAMYFHPDLAILLRRAGFKLVVLFTETPYDIEKEVALARNLDGCWTMERSCVPQFQRVNPRAGYIPHGWHPMHHTPTPQAEDMDVPAHDVVFVGSAFQERIEWFRAIDWTGIDLGLYGSWDALASRDRLRAYVKGTHVPNVRAAALYRRAKIALNLYRRSKGFGRHAPYISWAESMNPRAYELCACGVFHLSDARAEVEETVGDLVPTFTSAPQAAALIREWLPRETERRQIAAQLPARVAESSWGERATRVIGDLQSLVAARNQQVAVAVGG